MPAKGQPCSKSFQGQQFRPATIFCTETMGLGLWVQDELSVGRWFTKSCCMGSAYQENDASSQSFCALIS